MSEMMLCSLSATAYCIYESLFYRETKIELTESRLDLVSKARLQRLHT